MGERVEGGGGGNWDLAKVGTTKPTPAPDTMDVKPGEPKPEPLDDGNADGAAGVYEASGNDKKIELPNDASGSIDGLKEAKGTLGKALDKFSCTNDPPTMEDVGMCLNDLSNLDLPFKRNPLDLNDKEKMVL